MNLCERILEEEEDEQNKGTFRLGKGTPEEEEDEQNKGTLRLGKGTPEEEEDEQNKGTLCLGKGTPEKEEDKQNTGTLRLGKETPEEEEDEQNKGSFNSNFSAQAVYCMVEIIAVKPIQFMAGKKEHLFLCRLKCLYLSFSWLGINKSHFWELVD